MRHLRAIDSDDIELAREVAAITADRVAAYARLRMREIDDRTEACRQRWFPRATRIVTGDGICLIVSATGKSIRSVRLNCVNAGELSRA